MFTHVPTRTLRKHAYSNTLKILPPNNENFQIKSSDIFHISVQNIDCGYSLEPPRRGGGSNECPQPMFLSRNKKNNVYSCEPQFYCIKGGLYTNVFVMYNVCDFLFAFLHTKHMSEDTQEMPQSQITAFQTPFRKANIQKKSLHLKNRI